jgi:iron-sulfur cluster assembly accessory protein
LIFQSRLLLSFTTMSTHTQTPTEPSAVTLTESAARQIKEMLTSPENAGKNLRVYVEGGGCSGLQYGMVFDEKRPDDVTADFHGVSVLVDPFSANYLRGSVVDFSDALTGGGFKISNPNARQSCGCGKSFEA